MEKTHRGRPRRSDIDRVALEHALTLLEERGYDRLRMKDVAASAGIGLGALYRRWAGKEELVMAALHTDVSQRAAHETGDPVADLTAAVERIIAALPRGLSRLFAACLSEPDSELARVARQAKLTPMADGLAARLEKVCAPGPDVRRRAESGLSYLFWKSAVNGQAAPASSLLSEVLAIMGVTP